MTFTVTPMELCAAQKDEREMPFLKEMASLGVNFHGKITPHA